MTSNIRQLPAVFVCIYLFFLAGCDNAPDREARVTFQFDHPFVTQYTAAKPLFDSRGIKATLMMNINEIGKSKYYMSWDQLMEMHAEGWEIGAHTAGHPDMRTLGEEQIRYELSRGKKILEEKGLGEIKNFAYPFDWYNLDVLYIIPEYYRSARTSVAQTDFSINPVNIRAYELSSYEARLTSGNVDDAIQCVNKAKKSGRWLIFTLHEFRNDKNADYITSREVTDIEAMETLIDHIQRLNIPIVTTDEALDYYIGEEL